MSKDTTAPTAFADILKKRVAAKLVSPRISAPTASGKSSSRGLLIKLILDRDLCNATNRTNNALARPPSPTKDTL